MSYTFSRRAFLKYSAAAAIAVAGSSLLSGCLMEDPMNPVSTALNTALTSKLQVTAGLKDMTVDKAAKTCTFDFTIESARTNPIPLEPTRFSVAVEDAQGQKYLSLNNGGVQILDATTDLLKKGEVEEIRVVASNFPELVSGDTVIFKYMPIRENSEYSMTWKITPLDESDSSSTTESDASTGTTTDDNA